MRFALHFPSPRITFLWSKFENLFRKGPISTTRVFGSSDSDSLASEPKVREETTTEQDDFFGEMFKETVPIPYTLDPQIDLRDFELFDDFTTEIVSETTERIDTTQAEVIQPEVLTGPTVLVTERPETTNQQATIKRLETIEQLERIRFDYP